MSLKMFNELTQVFGIPGREAPVAEFIKNELKDYADEFISDAVGNLVAVKKGHGENKKKIMAAAHIDEIGFMVLSITDSGYLKFRAVGGISLHTSYANRVRFRNGVYGCIMTNSNIAEISKNDLNKAYIDIGAKSREEAEKLVKIGDVAHYVGEFVELANNRVMAKAFDNRSGAYILIESFKRLSNPYNDIYFAFTVQEEIGLRGAKVASNYIKPDIGIAVDVTIAFDTPADSDGEVKLGGGAAVKVIDSTVVCDEYLVDTMVKVAEDKKINYQLDVLAGGGTDAGAINLSNDGVRCCGISIPSRYCHSPVCIIDMDDVNACIDLMAEYCECEFTF